MKGTESERKRESERVNMYTLVCITHSRSSCSNYRSGAQGSRSCLNSGGDRSVARPTKSSTKYTSHTQPDADTHDNGNNHTKQDKEEDTESNGQAKVCCVHC